LYALNTSDPKDLDDTDANDALCAGGSVDLVDETDVDLDDAVIDPVGETGAGGGNDGKDLDDAFIDPDDETDADDGLRPGGADADDGRIVDADDGKGGTDTTEPGAKPGIGGSGLLGLTADDICAGGNGRNGRAADALGAAADALRAGGNGGNSPSSGCLCTAAAAVSASPFLRGTIGAAADDLGAAADALRGAAALGDGSTALLNAFKRFASALISNHE